ncbi:probable G-protein coupled receptor 139 [Acipenser ruthenus]|uniref:probable G-protein coupled receptor 139 n=1 Tax=Acipenser ruthenus TaxID=7906 RepID=UPI002741C755|nr:probable G-protein coupled receptor 139 [Acipenser ruthenus]
MSSQEHWMLPLQRAFYPILAIIGIPSNIVTFLIFWRRNCMLSKSSTYYLMAISVADTLVLILIVVMELVLKFNVEEPFWSKDPWCSLRDIFNYGAYNASIWLVVTFTAERFIAINNFSLKARFCTPKCAVITITLVYICSHLCAVPYFWSNKSYFNESTHPGTHACIYDPLMPGFYVRGLVWFQTVLVYIIPFVVIFTLNGLTLRQIVLSNRVHGVAGVFRQSASHFQSQKRKSVVLLITVSMTFALLSITRFVTQIILRSAHYNIDRTDYTIPINVAADIGTMLDLTNASFNMYLYACTQSKFRKELVDCVKKALYPCRSCKPLRSDYPSIIFHL